MAGKNGKSRAKPKSNSSRCDLAFPVGRINRKFKQGRYSDRVGIGAGIFCAAVLEYLACEILELAGNAASEHKKTRITPRHIQLAIRNDEELNKVLAMTTISHSGVLPNVNGFLFGKNGKSGANAVTDGTQEM